PEVSCVRSSRVSLLAAVPRRLQPRLRRGGALLPLHDVVHLLERHPDIVEAFDEPHAVGRGDLKGDVGTARPADALRHQVDRERAVAVDAHHAGDEGFRLVGCQHDRQQAVLQAILAIDVGKALRHDDADVVGDHAPHRRLARRAGAEIMPGHQNAGVAELRLVEDEFRIFAAVVALAGAIKQRRLVIFLEAARMPHRRDLVGVHVVFQERRGDAGMASERQHYAAPDSNCRTSAMRPAIAVAAAVAGLARWVRTFGPWRFSKLRLVVETQRSPGSPRSPLPPAHIEQPDSPQKKPASRNTRSSPAASASRFTVDEPGTTIATTPSATLRPRTTAAATSRSGSRALVQEPMKTRLTGSPASGVPGVRSI